MAGNLLLLMLQIGGDGWNHAPILCLAPHRRPLAPPQRLLIAERRGVLPCHSPDLPDDPLDERQPGLPVAKRKGGRRRYSMPTTFPSFQGVRGRDFPIGSGAGVGAFSGTGVARSCRVHRAKRLTATVLGGGVGRSRRPVRPCGTSSCSRPAVSDTFLACRKDLS